MKTFIIVLKESQLSVDISKDCIEAATRHNINAEVWPAVNGMNCDHLFEHYGIKEFHGEAMKNAPGVRGCFLSHYQLWLKCIELNETICILEHDGYFVRPLPIDVENHFTEILNLDPLAQKDKDYDQQVTNSLTTDIQYFDPPAYKGTMIGGDYIQGAYGYLIKPNAAKKLVTFTQRIGASPTDKHIGRNIIDLKSTTVPVVKLHEFYTTNGIIKNSSTKDLSKFIKE